MGKKLIITEKPSVARDFARVLSVSGNHDGYIENGEYVISWCVGHLVGMLYPEAYDIKYKSWKLEDLPFLPEEYKYGVLKPVAKQYDIINKLLHREDVDTVYWAGDSGKEGQTIEENIRNFGGVREGMKELRVWIDSQTDDEILKGIKEAKAMSEYAALGRSGIMRTIEDYSLGINFSRVLSVKYGKLINDAAATKKYAAIAVGRVMTCVLGMVVYREREIRNFTETPFYRVIGNLTEDKIPAEWKAVSGSVYFNSPLLYKENGFKESKDAGALIDLLKDKPATVEMIDKSISKKKPPLLFNITELSAECAKRFKINPNSTLQIAQDLYERKLTTYPRTDARVLTTAVAGQIYKNIYGLKDYEPVTSYVEKIISGKLFEGLAKTQYVKDADVTDHYAIIPTGQVKELSGLSETHKKVYDLIVRRFLSIFYPPAQYLSVKLTVCVDKEKLFSSAKILSQKGYMEIAGVVKQKEDEDNNLSEASKKTMLERIERLKKGDVLDIDSFEIKEGKTSPPKRYTAGTMMLAMENAGNLIEDEELREQIKKTGIGTSATRGGIIKKLVDIGYINENKKTLILTPARLGEMVFEVVDLNVPSLLNPEMTANWEKGLEGIINGSVDASEYRKKLEDYIREETDRMIKGNIETKLVGRINPFTDKNSKGAATRKPLDINCPKCNGIITTTSFGYGCSNYWDKDRKCDFSIGKIAGVLIGEDDLKDLIINKRTGIIKGFMSSKKKPFDAALKLVCEDGKYKAVFDFDREDPGIEYVEGISCPICNGKIVKKRNKGFECENYKNNTSKECKFSVGTVLKHKVTEEELKDLINHGITGIINDFVSKNGVKFSAKLRLNKAEDGGVSGLGFEFEKNEQKNP
ncbi:MAG: topoisomerase C-terminal repeat-containing protein [Lachnospiraceae bacterium]|nr:topoisomerase C-terminal repeat-containing protein [Lachnospiraceae bacterium]